MGPAHMRDLQKVEKSADGLVNSHQHPHEEHMLRRHQRALILEGGDYHSGDLRQAQTNDQRGHWEAEQLEILAHGSFCNRCRPAAVTRMGGNSSDCAIEEPPNRFNW